MRKFKQTVLVQLCLAMTFALAMLPIKALAATGWVNTGGDNWQYVVNDTPVTGWQKVGGDWFMFDNSGAMLRGWQLQDSAWYYLKQSGAMATGWQQMGGKWYFFKQSGAMAVGWLQVGSKWYYFYNNGAMAANTTIGSYMLDASGAWVTGTNNTNNTKEYPAKGSYTTSGSVYGVNLNQSELNQVRTKVKQIVSANITSDMSEYDKASVLHDYLAQNCRYAADWSKNRANTAWGALIYGEAQCSGYARAYKALMDEVGIYCHYVHSTNSDHQWNIIKLEGKWYIVDVTNSSANRSRAFFLMQDKHYAVMGYTWDRSKFPACNSNHPRHDISNFWELGIPM